MPDAPDALKPKRMTLSEVLDRLLTRSGERNNSTVTISRNAKAETQIEVTVRTGDEGGPTTVDEAEAKAREVYDRLHEAYPASNGHDNASVSYNRNAKGETQIDVEVKTGDGGIATIEEANDRAQAVYEKARAKFPLASGYVGAQPPKTDA